MSDEQLKTEVPAEPTDMRPTDVEYFLAVLPTITGSIVGKSGDPTSGVALSIATAREMVGELCKMGLLQVVTMLPDRSPIGIGAAPLFGPQNGRTVGAPVPAQDGMMIKQFPTAAAGVHR